MSAHIVPENLFELMGTQALEARIFQNKSSFNFWRNLGGNGSVIKDLNTHTANTTEVSCAWFLGVSSLGVFKNLKIAHRSALKFKEGEIINIYNTQPNDRDSLKKMHY